ELCLHFLRVPLFEQSQIAAEPKIKAGQHRQESHERERVSDQFPVAPHSQIRNKKQRPDFDADSKRQAGSSKQWSLSLNEQRERGEPKNEKLRISIPKLLHEVGRDEQQGDQQ